MVVPPRKLYTISQKLAMVKTLEKEQLENHKPLRQVARELQVDASQLRRWAQQKDAIEQHKSKCWKNSTAKSLHPGGKSSFENIEEDLLLYIFEKRDQGHGMTIRSVARHASRLDAGFRHKSDSAKDQAIRRFIASNGLTHRVHTHQSQRRMEEVKEEAKDWLEQARLQLFGRDLDYVLNMDQTPIFFSNMSRTTLEAVGARTVNVRTSCNSTMRVTVAVTVTASGKMLPPMFVFKGKRGGRIGREFGDYPLGAKYTVQDKAWMDEGIMKEWIKEVLKPYVETAPAGVVPLLFLDSYRCHMMGSIVNAITDLGVQVEHIPGGCTGLCQPVDVGINKPLKTRVRHAWEDWMISQGPDVERHKPPSRKTVAEWVVMATQAISETGTIIGNSWRHEPFSYFPPVQVEDNNPAEMAAV